MVKPFLPACALFSAYARTDAEISLHSFLPSVTEKHRKGVFFSFIAASESAGGKDVAETVLS